MLPYICDVSLMKFDFLIFINLSLIQDFCLFHSTLSWIFIDIRFLRGGQIFHWILKDIGFFLNLPKFIFGSFQKDYITASFSLIGLIFAKLYSRTNYVQWKKKNPLTTINIHYAFYKYGTYQCVPNFCVVVFTSL